MLPTLSRHWNTIQATLFPLIEKEVGATSDKHEQLIMTLEFARVQNFIRQYHGCVGRPEKDRIAIAHAFIAKMVFNLTTTRALIDRLNYDIITRRICGWERKNALPSESTFSRAFAQFSETDLPSRIQAACVVEHHGERVIGHISRDATAIEAREKPHYTPQEKTKKPAKKRGRPAKGEVRPAPEPRRLERQLTMTLEQMLADLPTVCDIGTKKNSKGYKESWRGYKLHIDTADGDIPISAILTSASVHDSQVALPLAVLTNNRVPHVLYEVMDSAYDAQIIRDYVAEKNHVALIDFNHRSPNDDRSFAPHEAERYKERSAAERTNSNLKDNYGGRFVRVRGAKKVLAHLMFGLLAITIGQTVKLII